METQYGELRFEDWKQAGWCPSCTSPGFLVFFSFLWTTLGKGGRKL